MQPLVREIFEGMTNAEIMTISLRSGVGFMTIKGWLKDRRTPRVDLLDAVAKAAGATLKLEWKEKPMKRKHSPRAPRGQFKIISGNKRIEIWLDAKLVGYVEDDKLFGIDAAGYAVEVESIGHRVEISAKLAIWRAKNIGVAA